LHIYIVSDFSLNGDFMDVGCINRVYSEDYQDYIVEHTNIPSFLENQYKDTCFHIVTNRVAVAYHYGKEVQSGINDGAYIIPRCYGLMSSSQVLGATGVERVQRQPALSLYGSSVMVGFIDTGGGVGYAMPQPVSGNNTGQGD